MGLVLLLLLGHVAELVYAYVSEAYGVILVGSSPTVPTNNHPFYDILPTMEFTHSHTDLEKLNAELNNDEQLEAYKKPCDNYKVGLVPRFFGSILIACGNVVYGKKPSYIKFRAIEVIARVPYHSWASAAYTLLTAYYADENKAMKLSHITRFARIAQDNETMHVVVVSHLAEKEEKAGSVRYTLIPMVFAFCYFWVSYVLYLLRPRWSLELNYMFENHAFEQYHTFITEHGALLKGKMVMSDFLVWYGRNPINQYEFFRSVRNDELIHRNQSIHEIGLSVNTNRFRRIFVLLLLIIVVLISLDLFY